MLPYGPTTRAVLSVTVHNRLLPWDMRVVNCRKGVRNKTSVKPRCNSRPGCARVGGVSGVQQGDDRDACSMTMMAMVLASLLDALPVRLIRQHKTYCAVRESSHTFVATYTGVLTAVTPATSHGSWGAKTHNCIRLHGTSPHRTALDCTALQVVAEHRKG